MIRWSDVDPAIPQPGWPGRRRAIVVTIAKVVGLFVFFVFFLAATLGTMILWAAASDGLGPR